MRISDWSSDVCSSDLCAHHLVGEFGELQQIVKILLGDRQALGHLRPDALIIGFHRVPIISGSLAIGDVLALPVFQVRETEGAFVIERFDPGYEFDLAMEIGSAYAELQSLMRIS